MVTDERETITIEQAAARLGISRNSAYNLANRGELPGSHKLGKRIVVSIIVFENWLHGNGEVKEGNGRHRN